MFNFKFLQDLTLFKKFGIRVHHGRNPFCIDKNYGGVLIIWDRMFGTFASEWDHDEKVQYGLVQNINSFNFGIYLIPRKTLFSKKFVASEIHKINPI